MAKTDIAKNRRGKNWATEEFEEFALVLVDEESCCAVRMEIVVLW